MENDSADITRLLAQWRAGDAAAENELFEAVQANLQRVGHGLLRRERNAGLQTTELVDQIYMRLVAAKDRDWQNRQHFLAIASRAMRRYLIDLARARGDVVLVGLDDLGRSLRAGSNKLEFATTVGRLLDEMQTVNPQWCSVVELRFFLGLTEDEAADVLGVKLRTLQRMWHGARRWLYERMEVPKVKEARSGK
jgi:RNA polymerase sigma-70 factor, ECF subfamily